MRLSIILFTLFLAACSGAEEAPDIAVSDALIRTPPQGRDMTAGYMTLTNTGGADRLIGASSDAAAKIELHHNTMENSVMRMRRVDGVDIPAGGEARFEQGGYHLMIFGAKGLAEGQSVTVTLDFETTPDRRAVFTVSQPASSGP